MVAFKPKPWQQREMDADRPHDLVPNPYDHTNQEWRSRGDRCIFRYEQPHEAGETASPSAIANGFGQLACGAFALWKCKDSTKCPLSHAAHGGANVTPKIALVSCIAFRWAFGLSNVHQGYH